MHRWVARTMLVTASVHGWHFYTEYAVADMTDMFFDMMPMGKYGIGAWGLLLWANVSGLAPFRRIKYELFVLQHILTGIMLLGGGGGRGPAGAGGGGGGAGAARGGGRGY